MSSIASGPRSRCSRAVERPQAPAGFVDRVLEAVRPTPWHRRLLDWLAAVRLLRFPVEAAAVVLVASLAVYVFQETPALRQAARPEISQDRAADSSVATKAQTAEPTDTSADRPRPKWEQTKDSTQITSRPERVTPPVPSTSPPTRPLAEPELGRQELQDQMRRTPEELAATNRALLSSDAPREPPPSAPGAPSMPPGAAQSPGAGLSLPDQSGPAEGRLRARRSVKALGDDGAAERPTSQSPPLAPSPAPELRGRIARENAQERAESAAPAPTPASRPPAPSAMRIMPAAHVTGRLTVRDRQAANRELGDLLNRVGGAETGRHTEAGGDTVDLVIPRAAYPAFAEGLARIGSWLPGTEPTELPDRVPITLRIAQ